MPDHLKKTKDSLRRAGEEILAEITENLMNTDLEEHLKQKLEDGPIQKLRREKRVAEQSLRRIDSSLKFIFVHGLCGWGSYSALDKAVPYWGFLSGDLIKFLNDQGFDCYAASVDPYGSAWDRACELYAQLAGKTVDYGKDHSSKAKHSRFGKDFSKEPLITDFENSRIVLIGHSFGGATVRLFSELLLNGSKEEREATDPAELSDFFKGGHNGKIHALVTLAAPTNGTTAYNLYDDVNFDPKALAIPEEYISSSFLREEMKHVNLDKESWDSADYDMHIDNALELNKRISTFKDIYYFSYPCSTSYIDSQGRCLPDKKITSASFLLTAYYMCTYRGTTKGGVKIGDDWSSNDGLVNEISARAPFDAPSVDYEPDMKIKKGIWHVMPTAAGDHMFLIGGMIEAVDVHPFYTGLLEKIIALDKK